MPDIRIQNTKTLIISGYNLDDCRFAESGDDFIL